MERFKLIAGTVAGTAHTKPAQPGSRNNQDSFVIHQDDEVVIGLVADGCGSGAYSETGARLIVQLGLTALLLNLRSFCFSGEEDSVKQEIKKLLFRVKQQILGQISVLARAMTPPGASFGKVIEDHFLATLVGFVILPEWSFVFHCGDGVYGVNGELFELGPFPDNAPPYLSYNLTGSKLLEKHEDVLDLQIALIKPTALTENIMVGCDGVMDIRRHADRNLPGQTELLGPVSQLWEEEAYVKNPQLLQRLLNRANRYVSRGEMSSIGLLPDDTTLVLAIQPKP